MKRKRWPTVLAGLIVAGVLGGCTARFGSFSQGGQPTAPGSAPVYKPLGGRPATPPGPAGNGGVSKPAAPAKQGGTKPAPAPTPAPQPAPAPSSVGKGEAGGTAPSTPVPAVDPNKLAVEHRLTVGGGEFLLTVAQGGQRWAGYHPASGTTTWAKETVPSDGAVTASLQKGLVLVDGRKAGAPQYTAFQVAATGLTPVNWYERIAPQPVVKQGPFLLVDKNLNALWYFQDGKLQKAYRVATGRQTAPPMPNGQNYKTNYFTPEGEYRVTNYVKNPAYYTLNKNEHNYAGGQAGNPLGTRWMGFTVFGGDGANIWGIHGTSHPEMMGTWVSDGCIRMYTNQVEELFGLLGGRPAVLQVVSGR
jgi:lipoprotein-anchoring transpeptidase ErfK/SrfK